MRCEFPELKRCCFCLPLRYGLIGTGCAKLVLDVTLMVYLTNSLCHSANTTSLLIFSIIADLLVFVDVAFSILLLYGCHKKDPVKLRIFYRYSIFLLAINILWVLVIIVLNVVLHFMSPLIWILLLYPIFIAFTFWIMSILLHLYLLLLVRSEVQKLENNMEFQFTNNGGGVCAMSAPAGEAQHSCGTEGGKN